MKVTPKNYVEGRDSEMTPPFQELDFFKDWTSYLLVRDPWERFISGLITEMDNGMSCPWIYDMLKQIQKKGGKDTTILQKE